MMHQGDFRVLSDLHAGQHSHMMQEFPTLVLKAQTYTYPDGRSATLLMVEGTLPMYYQVREVRQQEEPAMACSCSSCLRWQQLCQRPSAGESCLTRYSFS